jgi:type VI secretion system protein ImpJ
MKIVKPVRWKEGMFLRPHHFQQYDLYLEARESCRLHSVESHEWGLLHAELDEDALANFVLNIRELRAVLPDGTLVDVPENARIAGRPFEDRMSEVGRALEVHVGVRDRDERGPQTPQDGAGTGDTRYLPTAEEVFDLDAGRDPVPVERLTHNLRIFLGEEPRDGYSSLPLARLVRTGDTVKPIRHDREFAPPALILAASPVLHEAARAVVERLSVVLRDLGQQRGGNDPDPLILYYGLSGSLPVLKDMVQEGRVHPRELYRELARLAGALFYRDKEGRSAEEIKLYDHREPAPVFLRLRDLISELSEIAIRKPYLRCPLERKGDLHSVALPEAIKRPGARFFLEVAAGESGQRLPTLMMTARISNPSRIDFLRANALPGVPTEVQSGPPPGLPRGQTGTYYRLKHEEGEWTTHVAKADAMAAFIMNCPQDVHINLIIMFPEA